MPSIFAAARPGTPSGLLAAGVGCKHRTLRHAVIGLGGRLNGVPRGAGFDITAAWGVWPFFVYTKTLLI